MGQIKIIKGKVAHKHETEADWLLSSYVPEAGEIVIYDEDDKHPYSRIKVGDGVRIVKDLPFIDANIALTYETKVDASEKLGEAKAYTNDNKIIDVAELPTTNIKETATYRVPNGIFVVNKLLKHESVCHIVQWDSVPTTAGESAIVEGPNGFEYVGYYNMNDNVLYGYINNESKTALKSFIDKTDLSDILKTLAKAAVDAVSNGWKTLEEIIDTFGTYTRRSWGGIITSQSAATNVDAIYLYLESKQYFYQHGAWVELHAGLGKYGTGASSEVFNTAENIASGEVSHAEGYQTEATASYAHSEGLQTKANGYASHAEGSGTVTTGTISHAEGLKTQAIGNQSHAEGRYAIAEGHYAHAEGEHTYAGGQGAHAEGKGSSDETLYNTYGALGEYSHSEGNLSTASGKYSHAEGWSTKAIGNASHVEGYNTEATSSCGHAEGQGTKALGQFAHTEGYNTYANGSYQHVQGKFNIPDVVRDADGNMLDADGNVTTDVKLAKSNNTYAHIVGNGSSNTNRSNAHTLDWNGNAWFAGDINSRTFKANLDGAYWNDAPLITESWLYTMITTPTDIDFIAGLITEGEYNFIKYAVVETTDEGEVILTSISNKTITSLTIPNNVTKIGADALENCKNLTSIIIPNSVANVGKSAFNGCSNLTNVYIIDIATWCAIDFGSALLGSMGASPLYYAENLYLNDELVTTVVLPEGAVKIGQGAFYHYTKLTSITIPDSVTSIGKQAFEGCTGLTSITIPDSVTSLGARAFENCTNLTSIMIGNGIRHIAGSVFKGCKKLTSITIPDSVTSIGSWAFFECTGLTSITIPDSVTSIAADAFSECTRLRTINVPWAEGQIKGAPWGAEHATINYNYTGE